MVHIFLTKFGDTKATTNVFHQYISFVFSLDQSFSIC